MLLVALAPRVAAQETTSVVIAGTALGGTWYVLSAAMAEVLNEHVPGIRATSTVGATVENTHFVGRGESEFGFALTDNAYYGYIGEREFQEAYGDLRAVVAGQELPIHLMVRADSDITSYEDLAGRRVALGSAGGGTQLVAEAVLEEYGLDYQPFFLTHPEGHSALADRTVDAQFVVTSPNNPGIAELTTTTDIRFIPTDPDILEAVLERHPYWFAGTIPAGTYRGQDSDLIEVTARGIIITNANVSDDVVYSFINAWFEHQDELIAAHSVAADWTLEDALGGVALPVHSGAVQYYDEIGIEVPADLRP